MIERKKLSQPQAQMLRSQDKFPLFCGGYGSGKTETLVTKAIQDLKESKGQSVGIYAPTFDQFKLNLTPRFTEALAGYRNVRFNMSDMTIVIPSLGRFIFRSMNNPDRIVGYEVYRSHCDELDTLPTDKAEDVWNKIIARNRAKGNGANRVSGYTTPEGFKFCYKRWEKDRIEGYRLYRAPTYSNPELPDDYVESLRATYPAALVDAYIEGIFVNMTSGRVFYYDRTEHRSEYEHKKGEAVRIGMDFNVSNMSAVIYVVRGGQWHAVDELKGISDTPAMVIAIKEKYAGCGIIIYPDATGSSRKSVDASRSDISLLKKAGFRIKAKSKNPFIRDRVIAANQAFNKGLLYINDSKCPEYAECMEQLTYDKNGLPDKSSDIDHLPDAGTYPIAYEMPVIKPLSRAKVHGA